MNSILVGNGINNITPGYRWDDLIVRISRFCGLNPKELDERDKHFPLLYEEIFLTGAVQKGISEITLKGFIAKSINEMQRNSLYDLLLSLKVTDIMTTNYDFNIEGIIPDKNKGVIDETTYSLFRHYRFEGKRIWHIHGDVQHPNSINLGFEQYVGQTQKVRDYVVTGTQYKSNKVNKHSLIRRLREKGKTEVFSWIDFFFTSDIHIVGLNLGFVETELWWLLIFRARQMARKNNSIRNTITYYIPEEYVGSSKNKIDMLTAANVIVRKINLPHDEAYYRKVISIIGN